MKIIKRIFLILALLVPFALISCGSSENKRYTAYIKSVHDGDTFTDSNGIVYRLSGVDTPEANDQFHEFEATDGIEGVYATLATKFTKDLIEHKSVTIIDEGDGKYGREAGQVIIDGKNLSVELVKNGLARIAYISMDPRSKYFNPDYSFYRQLLVSKV